MSAIFKMAAKTPHKKWAVKIQHCPISSKFYMWVDNDVPNWFLTSKDFYWSPFQNDHHNTAQIQHCPISTTFHMWVDYDVPNWFLTSKLPVAIFKMATTIPHKFNIVRFQRPELIPDIKLFLPFSIFKMAATIPQKFNIVQFQR
jgi:hypothetical protein